MGPTEKKIWTIHRKLKEPGNHSRVLDWLRSAEGRIEGRQREGQYQQRHAKPASRPVNQGHLHPSMAMFDGFDLTLQTPRPRNVADTDRRAFAA